MNIKFISYTGKYPNLCSGVLTVEIDGKEYKFGHEIGDYDWKNNCFKNDNFEQFWVSGGCIRKSKDWGMCAKHAPWKVNDYWNNTDEKHPQWVIDILPKLLEVFNENVPYGCCGGCI
jgi:hypothetical protein